MYGNILPQNYIAANVEHPFDLKKNEGLKYFITI